MSKRILETIAMGLRPDRSTADVMPHTADSVSARQVLKIVAIVTRSFFPIRSAGPATVKV
jgi:hypothetical protein